MRLTRAGAPWLPARSTGGPVPPRARCSCRSSTRPILINELTLERSARSPGSPTTRSAPSGWSGPDGPRGEARAGEPFPLSLIGLAIVPMAAGVAVGGQQPRRRAAAGPWEAGSGGSAGTEPAVGGRDVRAAGPRRGLRGHAAGAESPAYPRRLLRPPGRPGGGPGHPPRRRARARPPVGSAWRATPTGDGCPGSPPTPR